MSHAWDAATTLWNPLTLDSHDAPIEGGPTPHRGRSRRNGRSKCQVPGCEESILDGKPYFRRHQVCPTHAVASRVLISGRDMRFCQQCAKFELLSAFEASNRSCRLRLNRRYLAKQRGPASQQAGKEVQGQQPRVRGQQRAASTEDPTSQDQSSAGASGSPGGSEPSGHGADPHQRDAQDTRSADVEAGSAQRCRDGDRRGSADGTGASKRTRVTPAMQAMGQDESISDTHNMCSEPASENNIELVDVRIALTANLRLELGSSDTRGQLCPTAPTRLGHITTPMVHRNTGGETLASGHATLVTQATPRLLSSELLSSEVYPTVAQGAAPPRLLAQCVPESEAWQPQDAPAATTLRLQGAAGYLPAPGALLRGGDGSAARCLGQGTDQHVGVPAVLKTLSARADLSHTERTSIASLLGVSTGPAALPPHLDSAALEVQLRDILADIMQQDGGAVTGGWYSMAACTDGGAGSNAMAVAAQPSGVDAAGGLGALGVRHLGPPPDLFGQDSRLEREGPTVAALRMGLRVKKDDAGWGTAPGADLQRAARDTDQWHGASSGVPHPTLSSMARGNLSQSDAAQGLVSQQHMQYPPVAGHARQQDQVGAVHMSMYGPGHMPSLQGQQQPHHVQRLPPPLLQEAHAAQASGPSSHQRLLAMQAGRTAPGTTQSDFAGRQSSEPYHAPPWQGALPRGASGSRGGRAAAIAALYLAPQPARPPDEYVSEYRTVRMSYKLPDCTPHELGPRTGELLQRAAAAGAGQGGVGALTSAVRPGCTHLLVDVTARVGADGGCGGGVALPAALVDAVGSLARHNDTGVLFQAGAQVLSVDRSGGKVAAPQPAGTAPAPVLTKTSVAAVHVGAHGSIQVYGSGLGTPGVEFWGRMQGVCYRMQVQYTHGDGYALLALPLLTCPGLLVLEAAAAAHPEPLPVPSCSAASPLLSDWLALLVAPSERVAAEVNGLAARMAPDSLRRLLSDVGSVLDVRPLLSQPVNGQCPVQQSLVPPSSGGSKATWRSWSIEHEGGAGPGAGQGGGGTGEISVLTSGEGCCASGAGCEFGEECPGPDDECGTERCVLEGASQSGTFSTLASTATAGGATSAGLDPAGHSHAMPRYATSPACLGPRQGQGQHEAAGAGGGSAGKDGGSGVQEQRERSGGRGAGGTLEGGRALGSVPASPASAPVLGARDRAGSGSAHGPRAGSAASGRLLGCVDPSDLLTNADDGACVEALLGPEAAAALLARATAALAALLQRGLTETALALVCALLDLHRDFPDHLSPDLAPPLPPPPPVDQPPGPAWCLMAAAVRCRSLVLLLALAQCERVLGEHVSLAARGPAGLTPLHLVALLDQPYMVAGLQLAVPGVRDMWHTLADEEGDTPADFHGLARTQAQETPPPQQPQQQPRPAAAAAAPQAAAEACVAFAGGPPGAPYTPVRLLSPVATLRPRLLAAAAAGGALQEGAAGAEGGVEVPGAPWGSGDAAHSTELAPWQARSVGLADWAGQGAGALEGGRARLPWMCSPQQRHLGHSREDEHEEEEEEELSFDVSLCAARALSGVEATETAVASPPRPEVAAPPGGDAREEPVACAQPEPGVGGGAEPTGAAPRVQVVCAKAEPHFAEAEADGEGSQPGVCEEERGQPPEPAAVLQGRTAPRRGASAPEAPAAATPCGSGQEQGRQRVAHTRAADAAHRQGPAAATAMATQGAAAAPVAAGGRAARPVWLWLSALVAALLARLATLTAWGPARL